ncbi:MAG: hypothetical protein WC974_06915 [Thermoplasmata archaeon]
MNAETKNERLSFDEVLEFIQEQMDSCTIGLRCPVVENFENCSYSSVAVEATSSNGGNNLQTAELILTSNTSASANTCMSFASKNTKNKKLNRCKECYELALRIQTANQ